MYGTGAEAKMQACYNVNKAVDKERHMQCAKALVWRLERQILIKKGPVLCVATTSLTRRLLPKSPHALALQL